MRLSTDIRYDADPTRVFAMLIDPAFQEAKCQATGAISFEVEVTPTAEGGATILNKRTMPADDLPDFVRSFLGSTLRLVETTTWAAPAADGARTGTIVVEVDGAPVRFSGTLSLTADQGGTQESVNGDLKAAIPMLGSKIEKSAEPAVTSAIKVEHKTGVSWLASH